MCNADLVRSLLFPCRLTACLPAALQDVSDLPSPTDSSVQLKRQPGGHYTAVTFSGVADESQVQLDSITNRTPP